MATIGDLTPISAQDSSTGEQPGSVFTRKMQAIFGLSFHVPTPHVKRNENPSTGKGNEEVYPKDQDLARKAHLTTSLQKTAFRSDSGAFHIFKRPDSPQPPSKFAQYLIL